MGLPSHVTLLPETEEDIEAAKRVQFGKRRLKSHHERRREILKSSIFPKRSTGVRKGRKERC